MGININGDSVCFLLAPFVLLGLYEIFGEKFCVHLQVGRVTSMLYTSYWFTAYLELES
jgi:hypothetical protein